MSQVGKTIKWDLFNQPTAPSSRLDEMRGQIDELPEWRNVVGALATSRPLDVFVAGDPFARLNEGGLKFLDWFFAYIQIGGSQNRYRFLTSRFDEARMYLSSKTTAQRVADEALQIVRRQVGATPRASRPHMSLTPDNLIIGAELIAEDSAARHRGTIEKLIAIPAAARWLSIRIASEACPAFDGYVTGQTYVETGKRDSAGVIETAPVAVRRIHWVSVSGPMQTIETALVQCAQTATPLMVEKVLGGSRVDTWDDDSSDVNTWPLAARIRQWPASYGVPGLTPRSFDYGATRAGECLYVCDCGNVDEYYVGKRPPCSAECGRRMFQAWPGDGMRPARLGPAPFALVELPAGLPTTSDPSSREGAYRVQAIDGGRRYIAPLDGAGEMTPDPEESAQDRKTCRDCGHTYGEHTRADKHTVEACAVDGCECSRFVVETAEEDYAETHCLEHGGTASIDGCKTCAWEKFRGGMLPKSD